MVNKSPEDSRGHGNYTQTITLLQQQYMKHSSMRDNMLGEQASGTSMPFSLEYCK